MPQTRLHDFRRGSLRFDVSDTGPLDGPVVVLLHGFPGSRRTWDAVTPLLAAGGARVVAFDQRGYSPGARPRRRRDYRAVDVVGDVTALLDALEVERVHLVGHDWGGFVAWRMAAASPHRLSGVTVLSTPHPRAMLRSLVSSAQALRSLYIGFFQLPWLPEALLRPRLARLLVASGLPIDLAQEYQRFLSGPQALRGALNWYRGMWLPDRRRRRTAPDAISVDTTYIWGNGDQALGRRAAELTGRYVGAEYRFVELDENHWLPERAAPRVAQEVLSAMLQDHSGTDASR
ncbi:alpha/beta fold hydrolase [Microbacterium sp. zg.Y625]|uniref:alpha/beta fold hydrolase n=1 Tax=Microbacterium jiangjiandongii TaxID=3049071 RepID=UPI00214C25E8|nr:MULTISPECIES: alpha/beta fold hydrolase [unclassified Microbacterium]MCR2792414.1 alpha/beta fold hydrolase [Microbacterium sp. zg.Y625]WIM26409.1 alpha/beta fold hydrolase [Microbacterium sp. zg-Y625]